MGCFESRPKLDADNFNTIGLSYVGGKTEPNLGPIDALDHVYRDGLLASGTYGKEWENTNIKIDDNLDAIEEEGNDTQKKLLASMLEKAKDGITSLSLAHTVDVAAAGGKVPNVGGKYTSEQVQAQLTSAGEIVQVAVDDNKKFPRQAVKAFLTNEYLADLVKQQKVLAENDPKEFAKKSLVNPGLSAISQAVASLVSKA
jgi:hypothetical protein